MVTSSSLKRLNTTGENNQHQHIWPLSSELTLKTDHATKLVPTVSISTLNVVDKLTVRAASVGILFSSSHTERWSNDQHQPQKITAKLHNLTYSLTTIGKKKVKLLYTLLIILRTYTVLKSTFSLKNQI